MAEWQEQELFQTDWESELDDLYYMKEQLVRKIESASAKEREKPTREITDYINDLERRLRTVKAQINKIERRENIGGFEENERENMNELNLGQHVLVSLITMVLGLVFYHAFASATDVVFPEPVLWHVYLVLFIVVPLATSATLPGNSKLYGNLWTPFFLILTVTFLALLEQYSSGPHKYIATGGMREVVITVALLIGVLLLLQDLAFYLMTLENQERGNPKRWLPSAFMFLMYLIYVGVRLRFVNLSIFAVTFPLLILVSGYAAWQSVHLKRLEMTLPFNAIVAGILIGFIVFDMGWNHNTDLGGYTETRVRQETDLIS